jgi:hypothetical protein
MKKYLIQYKMPLAGLDAWAAKPESERKGEETRLMGEWYVDRVWELPYNL